MPTYLPAGAVVELRGVYAQSHTSPATITAAGSAVSPVFIRGAAATDRARIQAGWEVRGTYLILENLSFSPGESGTGSLVLLAPSHHLSLRDSELTGTRDGGGLGVESWDGRSTIDNVVILRNHVHDNGDVDASFDQDVHGIHVGERASYIWIVSNELARNSGDGLQINAGSVSNQESTHHIYVGGNTAYRNKQTGFWAKQATDVIFSQNECWGHRPSNSSYGPCMGYQYATQWVWFLFNNIHDSDYGIAVSDDSGLGNGTESFFIGNVIHDIHRSVGDPQNDSAWSNAALMLAGGLNRYVIGNTIYDVDGGIHSPSPFGFLEIADNVIAGVSQGSHIFVEMPSLSSNTSAHHNLFDVSPLIRTSSGTLVAQAEHLQAMQSVTGDPLFASAAGGDFHIRLDSPAAGRGELNAAFEVFSRRYGISIAKDAAGRPRSGPTTDIGAFLAGSLFGGVTDDPEGTDPSDRRRTCANEAPEPPTDLTLVGQRDGALAVTWKKPAGCGTVLDYVIGGGVTPGAAPIGTFVVPERKRELAVSLLPPGSAYVWVAARNQFGTSGRSNELRMGSVPSAPIGFTGSVSGRRVVLSWMAPETAGVPSHYLMEAGWATGRKDAGRLMLPGDQFSLTGDAQVTGTLYLRVRALNSTGVGPPSNEVVLTIE